MGAVAAVVIENSVVASGSLAVVGVVLLDPSRARLDCNG
jgi:hypothetical protein